MCKKIIFISIGLIITDQIIKKIMLNKQIEIIKNIFYLEYLQNNGIVFGIKMNNCLVIFLSILIILIFIKIINKYKYLTNSISLIFAGSISNTIDRIIRGYVVDYINIFYIPIFNLADVFIIIGVLIFWKKFIFEIINKNKENDNNNNSKEYRR